MRVPDPCAMLTDDEAACLLGVQPSTLARWRMRGWPNVPYVRMGRIIRYRRGDVDAWIAKQTRNAPDRSTIVLAHHGAE